MNFSKSAFRVLVLVLATTLAACVSNPSAETWKLPRKASADSAMIIGRLDISRDKSENPDGDPLYLQTVNFMRHGKIYYFDGSGEKNYVLDNNYFVVPNIKPGKYYFRGFLTVHGFNVVTDDSKVDEKSLIEVKSGEIKFVGSFDYVKLRRSFSEKIRNTGTFQLRRVNRPTEQEMLQWLNRIGMGSGWEPAIRNRLQ